jgi:RND family efflux transporter MFP subunit
VRRAAYIGVAVLALALIALVIGRWRRDDEPVAVKAKPVEPLAAPTTAPVVEPFVGVVVPRQQVDVLAIVDAKVADVKAQIGARVKKGDVIATLDAESLRRQYEAAQATVDGAQADVRSASAEASAAQTQANRMQKLGDAVSGQERTNAIAAARSAGARVAGAKARVAEAEAQLKQLALLVESAAVVSPFDGVVSARYVDPGTQVAPGKPLVRVISADDLWIRFAVPEQRAGEIRLGTCIQATTQQPIVEAAGVVETLAPQVDTELRLLFAEARLTTPSEWKDRMQPGQQAGVTVRACVTP